MSTAMRSGLPKPTHIDLHLSKGNLVQEMIDAEMRDLMKREAKQSACIKLTASERSKVEELIKSEMATVEEIDWD